MTHPHGRRRRMLGGGGGALSLAPARTPPAAIARLHEAARAGLEEPTPQQRRLLAEGILAAPPNAPEALARFMRTEAGRRWAPLRRRRIDIRSN